MGLDVSLSNNTIKLRILTGVLPESWMPEHSRQKEMGLYKTQIVSLFGPPSNYWKRVSKIVDELEERGCLVTSHKYKSDGADAYYYVTKHGEETIQLLKAYENMGKILKDQV